MSGMKKQIGHYTAGMVREIPDEELAEQALLLGGEKQRRDALNEKEAMMDDFIVRMREESGLAPVGEGEEWFDPDGDVFSAYQLGARVTFEGGKYVSRRHVNLMEPTVTVWWRKATAEEVEKWEA